MAVFTHAELSELVDLLIDELVERRITGVELRIVGGAAIALAHNPDRDATQDVDCLGSTHRHEVEEAAAAVADRRGLPSDWLNFKVQMYAPDPDRPEPSFELLRERDGVRVAVGAPSLLLAMKLHAGRGRRDMSDVDVLLDACDITDLNAAVELYESFYSAEVMKPRSMLYLRSRFQAQ